MFINSEKLSIELKKLLSLIDKYNDIYINYYNTLNESSTYWSSPLSVRFFSDTSIEKNNVEMTIANLKNLSSIYNYMVEEYSEIGKKIRYDLSYENSLNQLFNKYIEKIDSTLILYRNLSLETEDVEIINKQMEALKNNKKRIIDIKNYYNELFNKLKEIEIEVKNKLLTLDIKYIKENDIQQYL